MRDLTDIPTAELIYELGRRSRALLVLCDPKGQRSGARNGARVSLYNGLKRNRQAITLRFRSDGMIVVQWRPTPTVARAFGKFWDGRKVPVAAETLSELTS